MCVRKAFAERSNVYVSGKNNKKYGSVKPVLTTTSAERPPVNKDQPDAQGFHYR
jgi:hypothetical protein